MANNTTEAVGKSLQVLIELNLAERIRLVPTAVFLGILAFIGLVGNGYVIHVYRTQYKMSNAKVFVMCVAAMDLFSCFVAIPLEIVGLMDQYLFEYTWLCKCSRFINTFGTCSSSFILLFIAIDRYRKVCKPLKRQFVPKHAKYLCLLSVMLGLLVSWPAFIVYGRKTFEVTHETITETIMGTECSTSDNMSDSKIPFFYTLLFSVMFVAGIVSMSVLYCLIGCRIQKQAKRMALTSARSLSIPMTSSVCVEKDAGIACAKNAKTSAKENNIQKKNKSIKKRNDSSKRTMSDESWTDRPEPELSYTSYNEEVADTTERNSVDVKQNGNNNTVPVKIDEKIKEEIIDDNEKLSQCDTSTVSEDNTSQCVVEKTEDATKPDTDQAEDKITLRSRITSIGSGLICRIRRFTSFDQSADTVSSRGHSQYLKQARARKTSFIMFLISLAYILSYLPHLIVMALRVVQSDFVDQLTDNGRAVYKFFLRSYFMNCAINPVIYGVCDTRFRNACTDLLNKCFRRR